jgi:hypothetical protein
LNLGSDLAIERTGFAPRPVLVVACGGRVMASSRYTTRTALLAGVRCRWMLALLHGGSRGFGWLFECQS